MKRLCLAVLTYLFISAGNYTRCSGAEGKDWLISTESFKSKIGLRGDGKSVVLSNGLISRTLRLKPNAATVDYRNLMTGDCILNVNPQLKEKALVLLYDPTDHIVKKEFILPLYCTGLAEFARSREQECRVKAYRLNRDCEVDIKGEVRPGSFMWCVVE
jgi:hypothetical protein